MFWISLAIIGASPKDWVHPGPGSNIMSDQVCSSDSLPEANPVTTASAEHRSLRADLLKMILRKEAERRGAQKPSFDFKSRPRAEWRYGA